MEDERLSAASKALARGWKMLSKHCDSCGLPLFLVNDREVCVYCQPENEQEVKKVPETITDEEKSKKPEIEVILYNKLHELIEKLDKETEITRTKDILEAIEICTRILKGLKSL